MAGAHTRKAKLRHADKALKEAARRANSGMESVQGFYYGDDLVNLALMVNAVRWLNLSRNSLKGIDTEKASDLARTRRKRERIGDTALRVSRRVEMLSALIEATKKPLAKGLGVTVRELDDYLHGSRRLVVKVDGREELV